MLLMQKQTLILQPIHTSSSDILRCFATGAPLSSDQKLFLDWHQNELSGITFDPIIQYYITSQQKRYRQYYGTFLLPHEKLNPDAVQQLKKRIQSLLQNKYSHVIFNFTHQQFLEFEDYTVGELVFWHSNVYVTGRPLVPGGVPPIIFFRWGNFFGILKYVMFPDERAQANLLVYFEEMKNRNLDQCVYDYNHQLKYKIELQNRIAHEKNQIIYRNIQPPSTPIQTEAKTSIKPPELKLLDYYLVDHVST